MKFSGLVFLALMCCGLLPTASSAQLTAYAGNDTMLCSTPAGLDTAHLGGSPTATGGVPPYTYHWSTIIEQCGICIPASSFLDDTTAANPMLTWSWEDLFFVLEVTDSVGTVAIDTVCLQFSHLGQTLEDKFATITAGDSVRLYPGVGGGIGQLTVVWTPATHLSNPNEAEPWASPPTSTTYYSTVTDSIGCSAADDDPFEVYVLPVAVEESQQAVELVEIRSSEPGSIFMLLREPVSATLYDLQGRVVLQRRLLAGTTQLTGIVPGSYVLMVSTSSHMESKRLIVR